MSEAPPPPEMSEPVDATSTDAESTTSNADADIVDLASEPAPDVGEVTPAPPVVPPPKETMLADAAIVRFVEANTTALHDAREVSTILYGRFVAFADSMNWRVPASHEKFCSLLVQIYRARSVFERDDGNVCRYILMPPLVPVKSVVTRATNKLHEFLAMDDDDRGCSITWVKGHVTWELDLQAAFEKVMGGAKYAADPAVFGQFGFTREPKAEHACLRCKQIAKARGGKCCDAYLREKRRLKIMIHDMCIRQ